MAEELNLTMSSTDNRYVSQKFILTGHAKVGKSEFMAAQGEKAFFFRLAPEFLHLRTVGEDCRDMADVQRTLTKIFKAKREGNFPCEAIILDPGKRLAEFIADEIATEAGVESIGDIPHGKGWNEYKKRIRGFMKSLEDLGVAVWITIHSCVVDMPEAGDKNKTFKREILDLSEKTERFIAQWADHILHVKTGWASDMEARALICQGNKFL